MPSAWSLRNAASAAVVVGLMAVSVGALWLVSRDASSSAVGDISTVPRASVAPSLGCQNFANYWLHETSVDIEPKTLEGFTNCRLAEDGRWYVWNEVPEGEPPTTIPAESAADAGALRARVIADLDALRERISPELIKELEKVYWDSQNAVIGQVREGASLSSVRTRYARLVNAFTLDPDRAALAGYIGWAMQERIDSYGVFRRACLQRDTGYLRQPCVGMEDNLSIRYAPWFWELRNPLLLDAYLAQLFTPEQEQEPE